ncbi:site-specific integrase [Undibacterium sp. Ji67W]|uniref:site-specific integrase n=1 Tax=Undibacterium sp. Ji67W TaxID=3413042 RepID=UPI003BF1AA3D
MYIIEGYRAYVLSFSLGSVQLSLGGGMKKQVEIDMVRTELDELNLPRVLLDAQLVAESKLRHEFIAAATSENTRRAYRSAIRHFLNWGGQLPADVNALISYLIEHAEVLNPRTLSLKLTAISQWHRHQGFHDPCVSTQLRKVLLGIERKRGRPKQKASALLHTDLEKIVIRLQKEDSLKAIRDNALLQIGFFGGFRRSELVGLQVDSLNWEAEGLLIQLPKSKTDQSGEGILKAIPYGKGICCPCLALKKWLEHAKIHNGSIFRSVNKWGQVGESSLNASSVNSILLESAKLSGLDHLSKISSHSLRRGMATSAYRAGASFRDIKRQGGWRFDGTVQGYIEEADQFKENAMVGLLGK